MNSKKIISKLEEILVSINLEIYDFRDIKCFFDMEKEEEFFNSRCRTYYRKVKDTMIKKLKEIYDKLFSNEEEYINMDSNLIDQFLKFYLNKENTIESQNFINALIKDLFFKYNYKGYEEGDKNLIKLFKKTNIKEQYFQLYYLFDENIKKSIDSSEQLEEIEKMIATREFPGIINFDYNKDFKEQELCFKLNKKDMKYNLLSTTSTFEFCLIVAKEINKNPDFICFNEKNYSSNIFSYKKPIEIEIKEKMPENDKIKNLLVKFCKKYSIQQEGLEKYRVYLKSILGDNNAKKLNNFCSLVKNNKIDELLNNDIAQNFIIGYENGSHPFLRYSPYEHPRAFEFFNFSSVRMKESFPIWLVLEDKITINENNFSHKIFIHRLFNMFKFKKNQNIFHLKNIKKFLNDFDKEENHSFLERIANYVLPKPKDADDYYQYPEDPKLNEEIHSYSKIFLDILIKNNRNIDQLINLLSPIDFNKFNQNQFLDKTLSKLYFSHYLSKTYYIEETKTTNIVQIVESIYFEKILNKNNEKHKLDYESLEPQFWLLLTFLLQYNKHDNIHLEESSIIQFFFKNTKNFLCYYILRKQNFLPTQYLIFSKTIITKPENTRMFSIIIILFHINCLKRKAEKSNYFRNLFNKINNHLIVEDKDIEEINSKFNQQNNYHDLFINILNYLTNKNIIHNNNDCLGITLNSPPKSDDNKLDAEKMDEKFNAEINLIIGYENCNRKVNYLVLTGDNKDKIERDKYSMIMAIYQHSNNLYSTLFRRKNDWFCYKREFIYYSKDQAEKLFNNKKAIFKIYENKGIRRNQNQYIEEKHYLNQLKTFPIIFYEVMFNDLRLVKEYLQIEDIVQSPDIPKFLNERLWKIFKINSENFPLLFEIAKFIWKENYQGSQNEILENLMKKNNAFKDYSFPEYFRKKKCDF